MQRLFKQLVLELYIQSNHGNDDLKAAVLCLQLRYSKIQCNKSWLQARFTFCFESFSLFSVKWKGDILNSHGVDHLVLVGFLDDRKLLHFTRFSFNDICDWIKFTSS